MTTNAWLQAKIKLLLIAMLRFKMERSPTNYQQRRKTFVELVVGISIFCLNSVYLFILRVVPAVRAVRMTGIWNSLDASTHVWSTWWRYGKNWMRRYYSWRTSLTPCSRLSSASVIETHFQRWGRSVFRCWGNGWLWILKHTCRRITQSSSAGCLMTRFSLNSFTHSHRSPTYSYLPVPSHPHSK